MRSEEVRDNLFLIVMVWVVGIVFWMIAHPTIQAMEPNEQGLLEFVGVILLSTISALVLLSRK